MPEHKLLGIGVLGESESDGEDQGGGESEHEDEIKCEGASRRESQ